MSDPLDFMWRLQISGCRTWPFFLWVPVSQQTGQTVWRLWLLTGWTDEYATTVN